MEKIGRPPVIGQEKPENVQKGKQKFHKNHNFLIIFLTFCYDCQFFPVVRLFWSVHTTIDVSER